MATKILLLFCFCSSLVLAFQIPRALEKNAEVPNGLIEKDVYGKDTEDAYEDKDDKSDWKDSSSSDSDSSSDSHSHSRSHSHSDEKCDRPNKACPVDDQVGKIPLFIANGAICTQGIAAFFLKLGQKNPSYICDCDEGSLQFFDPFRLNDVLRKKRNEANLIEFIFPKKAFSYAFNTDTCENLCIRDENGTFWEPSPWDPNNLNSSLLNFDVNVDVLGEPVDLRNTNTEEVREKRAAKKKKHKKTKPAKILNAQGSTSPKPLVNLLEVNQDAPPPPQPQQDLPPPPPIQSTGQLRQLQQQQLTPQQQTLVQQAAGLSNYVTSLGGVLKFVEGYIYPYCVTEEECHQYLVLTPWSGGLSSKDTKGKSVRSYDNQCLYAALKGLQIDVDINVDVNPVAQAAATQNPFTPSQAQVSLAQLQGALGAFQQGNNLLSGNCQLLQVSAISCNGCGPIKGDKIDKCYKQEF